MNADQLDRAIRDVLHRWTPDSPGVPQGIADRIVSRRRRRNVARVTGAALALAGVVLGGTLAAGIGDEGGSREPATQLGRDTDLLWRTTLPGTSWDACTTGPGAVYCRGTSYDGIGLDVENGKITWEREARGSDGDSAPAGSLPGVRDGVLYTYADHSPGASRAGTDLVALDVETQRVLWKHQLADDSRNRSSAVLFGGGVLVNAPTYKSVVALDDTTGRALWSYAWKQADCERVAIGKVPHLMCTPDSEKAPQRSTVVRLDPETGAPRTVATLEGVAVYLGTDGKAALLAAPAEGRKYLRAPGPATLIRVDLGSGKVSRHPVDGVPAGVVADGIVVSFFGDAGRAAAYSATDGKRLWTRDLGLELRRDPDMPEMTELASDAAVDPDTRTAYYADPSGNLVGLDLDTGEVRWRGLVEMPSETPVVSGVAPELMVYGHTLVGQIGNELFRVRPALHDSLP
ncbi:PQQ-binding-like beta-propeller repeat protein [Streptomyces sp. NPDC005017]|uniref:outer membrane protein assembly factor BamB family protein n=1 Tax=Streptomyces sp. NPDC005017 TaxID=3364706 RepID=UPI0036A9DDDE